MDLDRLGVALDLFRSMGHGTLPLHFAQMFLLVALYEPITYKRLEEEINLTNSSVSRTLNALSDFHRTGEPGLGLIKLVNDPAEGRRRVARLSAKGKAIKDLLTKI